MPKTYLILLAAVATETIGTTALQASQQFSRLLPSLLAIAGYGCSFWLLSLTLKILPVGVVYALWSGLGIILIALIGFVVFGQKLDLAAVLGMGLILAGILVINLFSHTGHS
ncbi:Methyl viologen resistance protein C [Thalassovita gelatinovora]|uniref:Methyl viologen resistance protein C n=1 Tax=Thalassovita gelatinovora TaxID=53501 RepID=A0A0P1FQV1_THAGE|nr:SMR family transporter [Thalassovita gelatinovora]QIZ79487.1 QacE family quaternary ammonium compound efflux SMR transporter [Thalassovita gelatinovora]CUH62894.1 Methyl viologen resistance protein C [Thalassovita gelatinovora]SEQ11951.1 small multidrug resistance pump [Thalassovita gelatinovora]